VVEGFITEAKENQLNNGFLYLVLAYTYEVEGERYVGRETFSFAPDEEPAKSEAGWRQHTVKVHYRLDKPSVSALDRENLRT
jgi:hypothetical protein